MVGEELNKGCTGQDPEMPTCARIMFTGTWRNCTQAEKPFALEALFERHPGMKNWPSSHSWQTATIDIDSIWMLDLYVCCGRGVLSVLFNRAIAPD